MILVDVQLVNLAEVADVHLLVVLLSRVKLHLKLGRLSLMRLRLRVLVERWAIFVYVGVRVWPVRRY